jgi:hypothetical protein
MSPSGKYPVKPPALANKLLEWFLAPHLPGKSTFGKREVNLRKVDFPGQQPISLASSCIFERHEEFFRKFRYSRKRRENPGNAVRMQKRAP